MQQQQHTYTYTIHPQATPFQQNQLSLPPLLYTQSAVMFELLDCWWPYECVCVACDTVLSCHRVSCGILV